MNQVEYVDPRPTYGYSNAVAVSGPVRTIYVGGQNATGPDGRIVGEGNLRQQVEQTMKNLEATLAAAGASLDHIVKWTIFIVQGQSVQEGFEASRAAWGSRTNFPAITGVFVSGLARPGLLVEIEAVAVVPG